MIWCDKVPTYFKKQQLNTLDVFSSVFVADSKIIYGYHFVAPLSNFLLSKCLQCKSQWDLFSCSKPSKGYGIIISCLIPEKNTNILNCYLKPILNPPNWIYSKPAQRSSIIERFSKITKIYKKFDTSLTHAFCIYRTMQYCIKMQKNTSWCMVDTYIITHHVPKYHLNVAK